MRRRPPLNHRKSMRCCRWTLQSTNAHKNNSFREFKNITEISTTLRNRKIYHVGCWLSILQPFNPFLPKNRKARRTSTVRSSALWDASERSETCIRVQRRRCLHLLVRIRICFPNSWRRRIHFFGFTKVLPNKEVQFIPKKSQLGKFTRNLEKSHWTVSHHWVSSKKPSSHSQLFVFPLSLQYGFTKVRRGPDTDMYAHQSFIRGKPELLLNLRKCSSASRRKMSASSSTSDSSDSSSSSGRRTASENQTPVLSPRTIVDPYLQTAHVQSKLMSYEPTTNQTWLTFHQQPLMPKAAFLPTKAPLNLQRANGAGRLDLLALAVEHASF